MRRKKERDEGGEVWQSLGAMWASSKAAGKGCLENHTPQTIFRKDQGKRGRILMNNGYIHISGKESHRLKLLLELTLHPNILRLNICTVTSQKL